MLLWLSFAVLTAAVLAYVLRPALMPMGIASLQTAAPDVAVYADQIADLDAQLLAEQIGDAEHAALRNEVARRLLRLKNVPPKISLAKTSQPVIVMALAGLVPLASLGIYLALGAPGVPAKPFARTAVLANATASDLIAQVEARLEANPKDGRGWDVVAPVYLKLERFADAAQAYQQSLILLGETPGRLAGFAEATVMANDGIVTEAARTAYEKLVVLVPERTEPRFWLALAKEQDGNRAAAAADYRALLAVTPANAPSRGLIEQRLAALTPGTSVPLRGPTTAEIDAATSLSGTDQRAMITQMVENLAARLRSNRNDLNGWQRLITAYVVLKDANKATAALVEARTIFQADAAAEPVLAGLARQVEAMQ